MMSPKWNEDSVLVETQLENCAHNSLKMAVQNKITDPDTQTLSEIIA